MAETAMQKAARERAAGKTTLSNNVSGTHAASGVTHVMTSPGHFEPVGKSSAGSDYIKMLQNIQAQNNAWSAAQAQKQMDFQASQGAIARQFNHDEAELSRLWQERMSNTSHQREIKDLQAAGLNPVLSAMGGSGAPVTSGSTAAGYSPQSGSKGDTDTSLAPALVSLLGSSMAAQASIANTAMSARTQESVADKYTAMSKLVAEIQQETTLSASTISAMASRYAADKSADASKVSASIHAAAAKYGYDVQAMTQRQLAAFNAEVNKDLAQMGYQHDFDIREAFPSSMSGLLSSLFGESILGNQKGLSGLSDLWPALKDLWSKPSFGGGGSRSGR